MSDDVAAFLRARLDEDEAIAEKARDFDYARCGSWEERGPYPAASGEADGVSRPRGNLRSEIGRDDIFLEAELPWDLIPHMARHDPARVLREAAAKRRIVDAYAEVAEFYRPDPAEWHEVADGHAAALHTAVLTLAAVYADHPDYREEWRP